MYKPEFPDGIAEEIKAFTNNPLPHFFKYAKDKSDDQVTDANGSFVNKIGEIIPNPRINCRKLGLGEIDYTLMMSDPDIEFDVAFADNGKIIKERTNPVIVKYYEFNKEYYLSVDSMICDDRGGKSDSYMRARMKYKRISDEVKSSLSRFGYSDVEVCDILVKFLYGIKKSSNKTALWMCYGDIIYDNLSMCFKPQTKTIQCVDCGEWFDIGVRDNRTCRCKDCSLEYKRELARLRKQKQRDTQ